MSNEMTKDDLLAVYAHVCGTTVENLTPEQLDFFEQQDVLSTQRTVTELDVWAFDVLQSIERAPAEISDGYNAIIEGILDDESLSDEEKAINIDDVRIDLCKMFEQRAAA